MTILKCKICGGNIELSSDKTFGTCECCGSSVTFPKIHSEQRAEKFNRGNHFRRIGEFDKALSVYEEIIKEDSTDAEAHWCCALCRFGVEYVEDPISHEWRPTCHRLSFDSFMQDIDYLAAIEHSEDITRKQYERDAYKISEVQRGILATSQNEDPFDVFICYKESNDNGERTNDSVIAQDIYDRLTEKGYRVFFSRITLEEKAGVQYEPYIFAALNSAKVMVVIGTSKENLDAVWVKNEWSRFIALMKKDHSKVLIPCYRDMNPYDMPNALSMLQSYDISKIGFIQDLIRGIEKYVQKTDPANSDLAISNAVEKGMQSIAVQQAQSRIARGNKSFDMGNYKDAYDYYYSDGLITIPDDYYALYRRGISSIYMSVNNPPIAEMTLGLEKSQKICDEYKKLIISTYVPSKGSVSDQEALDVKNEELENQTVASATVTEHQKEMIRSRDKDLIELIMFYSEQTSTVITQLENKRNCKQQAQNWCCAASVISVAANFLTEESVQEQWLQNVINVMDGWLNAKVTYLVTSSQGQKNVYYTMPDDFTAIIKNARQSCANAYNSLPSRVSHENELIDDSSAKQDLVNKLSAELSELKDKFEKEKNAFYESHPTIANETSNKSYKTFLGYVICVILCIASRLIWHIPIVIEIIALIIGFILLTLYNDISISNLEDKYFSAELKSLKTSVSDKEDELSKAKKEYDSAVSILQDFQKTKK